MNSLENIYGIMITSDPQNQIQIFSRLKPQYHITTFYKNLFDVCSDLITNRKQIDLLSISEGFKDKNMFGNDTAIKISNLTNNLSLNGIVNLDNLIMQVENEYSVRQAHQLVNDIVVLKKEKNLNKNNFEKLINSLEFESIKTKEASNVDVLFEIIENHDSAKNGQYEGIKLGYECLDQMVLLENVDLMVVGARPAMGKTAFAISTMLELAQQKKHVVFFALEMSKKQVMRRVLGYLSNVDTNKIKYGQMSNEDRENVYTAMSYECINNMSILEGSKSINTMTSDLLELNRVKKVDVVIIDYLQKIIPKNTRSRYEQVTEVSNGVKLLTQNLGIPCIALAQLSRDSSKAGKRPTLPDLKESGDIEQDASIVSFLHRPEYYGEDQLINGDSSMNKCEFIIAKNREGSVGIEIMNVDLKISKFIG
jgi:replicative DNA helicase